MIRINPHHDDGMVLGSTLFGQLLFSIGAQLFIVSRFCLDLEMGGHFLALFTYSR